MKKYFVVAAIFLFLQISAFGEPLSPAEDINKGWEFYNICHNLSISPKDTNGDYLDKGLCAGYIFGALNQFLIFLDAFHGRTGKFYGCYLKKYGAKNFTGNKIMEDFINFLEKNPDYLKAPTSMAFITMMSRKFPNPQECLASAS